MKKIICFTFCIFIFINCAVSFAQLSESFVPMAIGNIYHFRTDYYGPGGLQGSSYRSYTITTDTLVDNIQYFRHPLFTENYVRYDSIRKNFLIYSPGSFCDGYINQRKIDSFYVHLNDTLFLCYASELKKCSLNKPDTSLGLNTYSIGFSSITSGVYGSSITYAKGIGVTSIGSYWNHEGSITILIGCTIYGKSYPLPVQINYDTVNAKYYNQSKGNFYFYESNTNPKKLKIVNDSKDTVMQNKRYVYNNYYYLYTRYDSLKGNIVALSQARCGGYNNESKLDSLASRLNDTIKYCTSLNHKNCLGIKDTTIFNIPITKKTFSHPWRNTVLNESYSSGFSVINFDELDSADNIITYSLRGAVIKGIAYGDTSIYREIKAPVNIAFSYLLSQNFPNPFNPSTKINYELQNTNYVSLRVFDLLGKEIAKLVNEKQNAGSYAVDFNSSEFNLPSGIYFYTLSAGEFKETRKMVLIK